MTDQNPAAFPYACPPEFHAAETGMSLRDWFAGQALSGLISGLGGETLSPNGAAVCASEAYMLADAMLAQRTGPST